jgi:hypothetical protein
MNNMNNISSHKIRHIPNFKYLKDDSEHLLNKLKELTRDELEIVSSDGYYKIVDGEEFYSNLDFIFHGTAINIVFNTTDTIFMKLKGE